jgi:hypothetical protein
MPWHAPHGAQLAASNKQAYHQLARHQGRLGGRVRLLPRCYLPRPRPPPRPRPLSRPPRRGGPPRWPLPPPPCGCGRIITEPGAIPAGRMMMGCPGAPSGAGPGPSPGPRPCSPGARGASLGPRHSCARCCCAACGHRGALAPPPPPPPPPSLGSSPRRSLRGGGPRRPPSLQSLSPNPLSRSLSPPGPPLGGGERWGRSWSVLLAALEPGGGDLPARQPSASSCRSKERSRGRLRSLGLPG